VNKKPAPVFTGIKENLALGSLPLTTTPTTNNITTTMQRLACSEDTTSESGLRKGGEGSIAGGTNQKDSGPDRKANKGRALQQLP
jgi:hypothetical protein